jgi:hypothetical protein
MESKVHPASPGMSSTHQALQGKHAKSLQITSRQHLSSSYSEKGRNKPISKLGRARMSVSAVGGWPSEMHIIPELWGDVPVPQQQASTRTLSHAPALHKEVLGRLGEGANLPTSSTGLVIKSDKQSS